MKKIMLMLMLGVVSCQNNTTNHLKVGLNAEYPPYEYLEGDQYVGFNVEVITKVLDDAGYTFDFHNMKFDGLLAALQGGKVDLIIGVSPIADRRKMVFYSDNYMTESAQVLVVHQDDKGSVTTENLSGKTVGVLLGSLQETILKDVDGVKIKAYNDYTGAILDLNNKKIDAILISISPSKEYLAQNPKLVMVGALENTVGGGYAFAMNKGQDKHITKINTSIQKLLDDGTVDKLLQKYEVIQE